jgi:putative colanic acid biosynthesis acetyltransferase WcaF
LRLFGAKIGTGVYIKPGIRVKFPWYLEVGEYTWLGEDVWIDNLAAVRIGPHCCVSQGAYFCTGNHDWSATNMKLFRKPIVCGRGSWVGAKAILCPGVTVGMGAIATAGSVVTRDIPAMEVHCGNPAQFVRQRTLQS